MQREPSPGVNSWALHLQWRARLEVTQPSVPARQPLLALRRRIAALAGLPGQAGAAWLQQAKLCRAAGGGPVPSCFPRMARGFRLSN